MKKLLAVILLGTTFFLVFPQLGRIVESDIEATAPRVTISSDKTIPIIDDLFWMGPSTGFPVPFPLTQTFVVPAGATRVYGTITPGPCEGAIFVDATPGYTSGGYPTHACSWIKWEPPPATVSVTVEYVGYWMYNYLAHVRWEADTGSGYVPYCLVGEPVSGQCPGSIYFEKQPLQVSLPIIMKGYSQ